MFGLRSAFLIYSALNVIAMPDISESMTNASESDITGVTVVTDVTESVTEITKCNPTEDEAVSNLIITSIAIICAFLCVTCTVFIFKMIISMWLVKKRLDLVAVGKDAVYSQEKPMKEKSEASINKILIKIP